MLRDPQPEGQSPGTSCTRSSPSTRTSRALANSRSGSTAAPKSREAERAPAGVRKNPVDPSDVSSGTLPPNASIPPAGTSPPRHASAGATPRHAVACAHRNQRCRPAQQRGQVAQRRPGSRRINAPVQRTCGEPLRLSDRALAGASAPDQPSGGDPLRDGERAFAGAKVVRHASKGDAARDVERAIAGASVARQPTAAAPARVADAPLAGLSVTGDGVSSAPLANGTVRAAPPSSRSLLARSARPISTDPVAGL